jgi:hypothetical protein
LDGFREPEGASWKSAPSLAGTIFGLCFEKFERNILLQFRSSYGAATCILLSNHRHAERPFFRMRGYQQLMHPTQIDQLVL